MKTPTQSPVATLTQTLRLRLKDAQSLYAKQPNAAYWDRTLVHMLAWQQWSYATRTADRHHRWDLDGIATQALSDRDANICDTVVRGITGQSAREILREFAAN
jgi:hypothetical protein